MFASLRALFSLYQFLKPKVSQGNVVTQLRCGGIDDHLLGNCSMRPHWKNFENRLVYGEVIGKSVFCCFFFYSWDIMP